MNLKHYYDMLDEIPSNILLYDKFMQWLNNQPLRLQEIFYKNFAHVLDRLHQRYGNYTDADAITINAKIFYKKDVLSRGKSAANAKLEMIYVKYKG